MGLITISVVSHGHAVQVAHLLAQISALRTHTIAKVIVTVNIPERDKALSAPTCSYPQLPVHWVHNISPQGFGANHNAAFALCESDYFCVLNPDIALHSGCPNPFAALLAALLAAAVGLAYPVQVDAAGAPLDYERALPTPRAIGQRHGLTGLRSRAGPAAGPSPTGSAPEAVRLAGSASPVHWASGAFLMFKSEVFRSLGGFDERYFMYCEDVDICLRARLAGYQMARADATVVHHTQRRTLKSLQHLAWHMRSLWRLWHSQAYLQYKTQFLGGNN